MSYSKIRVEPMLDGQVVRLVLAAPPGDILDATMMEEIEAAVRALAEQRADEINLTGRRATPRPCR